MSEKKSSGLSGFVTAIFAIVVIIRIGMIMSRKGNSANPGWDNTYLLWSVFLLVFLIGAYIWNKNKKNENEESSEN